MQLAPSAAVRNTGEFEALGRNARDSWHSLEEAGLRDVAAGGGIMVLDTVVVFAVVAYRLLEVCLKLPEASPEADETRKT